MYIAWDFSQPTFKNLLNGARGREDLRADVLRVPDH